MKERTFKKATNKKISARFSEPDYHFTRKLEDQTTIIKETIPLRVELDEDDGKVKWYKDGEVSQCVLRN